MAGISTGPKCSPRASRAPAVGDPRVGGVDRVHRLQHEVVRQPGGRHGRPPHQLHQVPRVMPVDAADQVVQDARVARRGGDAGAGQPRRHEALADPPHVGPHEVPLRRAGEEVVRAAERVGQAFQEAARQAAGEAEAPPPRARAVRRWRGVPVGGSLMPAPARRTPARAGAVSASIWAARAASVSASASVAGHMRLNVYHWAGASRTIVSTASAMAWVARATPAGEPSVTSIGLQVLAPRSGRRAGGGRRPARAAPRSARRARPARPGAWSTPRRGGPARPRRDSPSRRAGRARPAGAGCGTASAGCATGTTSTPQRRRCAWRSS